MGKKKKEAMALERERFLAGVKQRGTAEVRLAGEIFDQMETFAAYGFNKSHSAAYALITYQTAYLKAHYPTEFMAGLLSLEASDIDNTYKNIAECRGRGIAILPPDVNASREDFTAAGDTIRFGLGAVKGVGSKAIEAVLAAREDGPFTSLADVCLRVRGQLVNRRVIESLIKCGAFDSIERNRARLLAGLDEVMRWAASRAEERASSQIGLFGGGGGEALPLPLPAVASWGAEEELAAEREAIGFFITGHPLDRYEQDLRKFTTATTGTLRTRGRELPPGDGERNGRPDTRPRVKLGGVIHSLRLKNSKKGDRYATFVLEDKEGVVEVIAWPDTYRRHEAELQGGAPVVVAGALEISDERCQVIADEVLPLAPRRSPARGEKVGRLLDAVHRDDVGQARVLGEDHARGGRLGLQAVGDLLVGEVAPYHADQVGLVDRTAAGQAVGVRLDDHRAAAVAGEDRGVDQERARRRQHLVVEAGDHPGARDHVVAFDAGHPHGEAEHEELLAGADVELLHGRHEGHVGRAEVAELDPRLEQDAGVDGDDRDVGTGGLYGDGGVQIAAREERHASVSQASAGPSPGLHASCPAGACGSKFWHPPPLGKRIDLDDNGTPCPTR